MSLKLRFKSEKSLNGPRTGTAYAHPSRLTFKLCHINSMCTAIIHIRGTPGRYKMKMIKNGSLIKIQLIYIDIQPEHLDEKQPVT